MTTSLTPARLRCEALTDPLGINVVRPRLTWIVESDERGQRQTAFRLLVSSRREDIERGVGTLWDTGKVDTDETAALYAGASLASRQRCYWTVLVWDRRGVASRPSPSACWTMGLLAPSDWRARWIAYDAPYAAVARSDHNATAAD